ncbi:hypothetical protein OBV_38750 [Oscillibacter valericigenes Sjm18-20]|nr:hypothetical protein OBV_38750 [Oscillibacter valericigenes Sjm18-20]
MINLKNNRHKDINWSKGERIFIAISRWFWGAVLGIMTVWHMFLMIGAIVNPASMQPDELCPNDNPGYAFLWIAVVMGMPVVLLFGTIYGVTFRAWKGAKIFACIIVSITILLYGIGFLCN